MDKDNKRAQRRKDEQTIWMRRLNNVFNNCKYYVNNGEKHCLSNLHKANIPEELKNSKNGMLLKNTAHPMNHKNVGKHLDNKHDQKIERREGKKIINEEILNYSEIMENATNLLNKLSDMTLELKKINEQIDMLETMMAEMPVRLEELYENKLKIETDICWLKNGNLNI